MADERCRDCGRPLKRVSPEAEWNLQWAHTSLADAHACALVRRDRMWPVPTVGRGVAQEAK